MTRRKREARKEDKRQAAMAPANRALFDAVLRGDIKAAAVHLADGADPSYQSNAVSERNQGEYMSVLYISCMNGNVGLVELLLAHGADPNSQAS